MSFLSKNIEQINLKNHILSQKIKNHKIDINNTKIRLIQSNSEELNLVYNDILIHNENNPAEEALNIVREIKSNNFSSINIVLGIGLGYLFKILFLSTKGKVVLYEPNIDILKFTLEAVDFSNEIQEERVYIANTRTELNKCLEDAHSYRSSLNLCGLNSCHNLYSNELKFLQENLDNINSHLQSNYACLFHRSYLWVYEGLLNIPDLAKISNIETLRDKFKSVPAIVVSPGPSLDKTIEDIKQFKDKAVIFSTGNAVKKLIKNGINPDFATFIEVFDNTNQVMDVDISQTNIIAQSIANNNIFKLNAKRKFALFSNNDLFSRWISDIADFQ